MNLADKTGGDFYRMLAALLEPRQKVPEMQRAKKDYLIYAWKPVTPTHQNDQIFSIISQKYNFHLFCFNWHNSQTLLFHIKSVQKISDLNMRTIRILDFMSSMAITAVIRFGQKGTQCKKICIFFAFQDTKSLQRFSKFRT